MRVLSITQINYFLKSLIEGDGRLTDIYASGEISNFTDHYRSGHLYFSLKDEKSVIKAVMFSGAARRLRFRPKDGMRVIVRGRVSVYEPSGQYQFYVEEMQPDGLGALSLAFEQMKEKLSKEGLFSEEYKKPIPRFPQRVGIITSPTGAAVQDMLNILSRRWPAAELVFCPVLVQGDGAPKQLIDAVRLMNEKDAADVILIGRGGGSAEDLAAFNDEGLARAIFASHIPVISAVGHETDFTICDFVADLRAPTPSAAAELAVPDGAEVRMQLDMLTQRMRQAEESLLNYNRQMLDTVASARVLREPEALLLTQRQQLESVMQRLKAAGKNRTMMAVAQLTELSGRLDAMSPLKVLSRGYAILSHEDGSTVSAVRDIEPGEVLSAKLVDGTLRVSVLDIEEDRTDAAQ
ncbi:MAG: exodeoxyribonuclease VII large subunit [Clostridia bacterium]|nr:exodeoxyribonuclease VII large subunit [Clostridia bacterium]